MTTQSYDLIGDIHGQHDKLTSLLTHLGYAPDGESWKHGEGRKVVFLGDYIDRGPKVREVLHTVRGMVEADDALAIMGNHEYNAVLYHTPDGKGDWFRPRRLDRDSGLRVTLAQFGGRDEEWKEWLEWMRRLPMFLDLGALRAVHACWDAKGIARLNGKTIADDEFLRASAVRTTSEFAAVENVLKGPEMRLPEGCFFRDKEGKARRTVRVRWWDMPDQARVSHLAMPTPFDVPGDAAPHELRRVPNYGLDEPPVFFGHYWMPAERERTPLATNLACLDFSAAREGPLVAYRWDGPHSINARNFVVAHLP